MAHTVTSLQWSAVVKYYQQAGHHYGSCCCWLDCMHAPLCLCPCPPALNGNRSRSSICRICARQPLSDAKALSTRLEPIVKNSANLLGDSSSVGSPMKKAKNRNSSPAPRKLKK